MDEYKDLLDFLKLMQEKKLFDQGLNQGKIVLADDQYVIRQQISMSFEGLGL